MKLKDLILDGIRNADRLESVNHRTKRHFSPTDSSKCPRMLWYEWKNFPKEPYTDKELLIFAIGRFTHEYLQSVIKNQLCAEYRIDTIWNGVPVAGYVDSIVFDGDKLVVVDFKTIGSYGLEYVAYKPKEEHVKQVNLYLDLLKMNYGGVLYWSKENGSMIEHDVLRDQVVLDQIKELFLLVQKHLTDNTLPEAKYDPENNWLCKYCSMTKYCKKNMSSYDLSTQAVLFDDKAQT
jgi:CRISPR/Cas system-associated exonuclease Cas4 (RecB family)